MPAAWLIVPPIDLPWSSPGPALWSQPSEPASSLLEPLNRSGAGQGRRFAAVTPFPPHHFRVAGAGFRVPPSEVYAQQLGVCAQQRHA
jgi:hypothetical protein